MDLILQKPTMKNSANSNNAKWRTLKDLGKQDPDVSEDDRKSKLIFFETFKLRNH